MKSECGVVAGLAVRRLVTYDALVSPGEECKSWCWLKASGYLLAKSTVSTRAVLDDSAQ